MNVPNPVNVTLLALQNGILSTLVGPLDVFTYTGRAWNHLLGKPEETLFRVRVASLDGGPVVSRNGLQVAAHCAMEDVERTEVILVTSGGDDLTNVLTDCQAITPWLKRHYGKGTIIAGVCSGSFLLAEAGLLNGLDATTHWGVADAFAARYPSVNMVPEALFVDQDRVLTAGGANAGADLALHLVRRLAGDRVALEVAGALLLDLNRQNQACFAPLLHHRRHGDDVMGQVQDWLEDHYHQPVNLEKLAGDHHMSTRNFKRRFKKATGETLLSYLQKLRMWSARSALGGTRKTVEQIAFEVGYEDVAFFRRLFKRQFGLTPGLYRERFTAMV